MTKETIKEQAEQFDIYVVGSSVKLKPTINDNPKHRGKNFIVKEFLTHDLVKVKWKNEIEYFYKRELILA
tara:strand:- start:287 stop:496 length:210 start_codon:yes stop_codon:yes gene_type:complete